jgi:hypothetical protein
MLMASALLLLPGVAWSQVATGSEFQVNTYTTAPQGRASVAAATSGSFVVVWQSLNQDGDNYGVFGRRYDASGAPLGGSEFRINAYTTSFQRLPKVASDASGDIVVVWESLMQDGSGSGVFGRRFNSAGTPVGTEFQVNSGTTSSQSYPTVASDPTGNFVVVWSSALSGTYDVFAKRYNASGTAQGAEFRVNAYTTGTQIRPSVAVDASGNFVVVWESMAQDGSDYGVFGRRYDGTGTPQGAEFQVNAYTTNAQSRVAVASDAGGSFVVVWQSFGQINAHDILGRRYDTGGTPIGAEFVVNSYTTGSQGDPGIAPLPGGGFVVVWGSNNQDGSFLGAFSRVFDVSGAGQGSEFRINTYTTSNQAFPAVASDANGNFVVMWDSIQGAPGSASDVFGQRYLSDLIFKDGFDSGTLAAWSAAALDGGDLSISTNAALNFTTAGLQARVNDTNSIFVQDDTPIAENRYRARFYFDPNGFDPGEAQSHFRIRFFIASDPSGFRVITLVLKRQAAAYSIEARARRNDGTRADTGFFPISDAPHFVELDWSRATAPGASDGTLELWIDNSSMATLTGIDNDLTPVEFVRMGALAIKTGAAGTLFYDEFESRRQTFIGP